MSRRSGSYPKELRERAVRLVEEVRPEHASEWAAIESVASKLGIGSAQTVHKRVRKADVEAGTRPGTTSVESAEMRKLRAENRELRRANEILKLASAFFAAELDRPQRRSSNSSIGTRKYTGSSRSAPS
jgi:transposase